MKKFSFLTLLFLVVAGQLFAGPPLRPDKYENRIYAFSLTGSFGYTFVKVDERHSLPGSSLLGLGGMGRFHIFIRQNIHLQLGLEILSQKMKFNTYYFKEGHSVFYDGSFGYTHRFRMYELYVPVMIRIGTNVQETNAPSAFYFMGGIAPRAFLAGVTVISEDATGKDIWGGGTETTFEHYVLGEQTSTVLLGGMGIDKRFGWSTTYMSFELIYRYSISRFRYRGNFDSNDLMIRNSCLTFQVGFRFQ